MNRRGHYRMHRGWMENPVLAGEPFTRAQVWCWLIEEAAWKAETRTFAGTAVRLDRGQLPASLRQLAGVWGWDRWKVDRFLDRLEEAGMISRRPLGRGLPMVLTVLQYDTYQGGDLGGECDTSSRSFPRGSGEKCDTPATPNATPFATPKTAEMLDSSGCRATPDATPSATQIRKKKKEYFIAQQGLDLGTTDPDGQHFERFWQVCPRKVGKGQAKPAFAKALRKAPASSIIAAMAAFAGRVRDLGTEERFIPHPATWLNGERWIEEAPHEDHATTNGQVDRRQQEQFDREYEQAKALGDDALRAFFARWREGA